MGSWFSNIHIRKQEAMTLDSVAGSIRDLMTGQHFTETTEAEADGVVAILTHENSGWITVCSDLLTHESPDSCRNYALPLSEALDTDVLGISCFDSDYLYLNLHNAREGLDAWLGIGSAKAAEIKRRSGLAAWKKKVTDYSRFCLKARMRYVFAEAFLGEAEPCLGLPVMQAMATVDELQMPDQNQKGICLYFKCDEATEGKALPVLKPWLTPGGPCIPGKACHVEMMNYGGQGRGLSVFFVGPYVEHEEITFENVELIKWNKGERERVPVQLQKVQLSDGQWAYYYRDPKYRLLTKLPDRADVRKQGERGISIVFTPVGNPRKMLDVTVVLSPDQNPQGQAGWNVWQGFGSKQAYIRFQNQMMARFANIPNRPKDFELLKEEDFD